MAIAYNPRIVTDELVLCLDAANTKSYPGSGTTWTDLSGNGNNGTLTNGPTYNSSNGGSIVFDGVNDYVNIPYSSIFNMQNFTLSIWVKYSNFNQFNALITNPQTGTIAGDWTNPYQSWMLRCNYGTEIEVSIGTTTTLCYTLFNGTISTNTVYNIVGTFNASTGTALGYLNGSSLSRKASNFSGSVTINYTSKPVVIGTDYGGGFSNCTIYNASVYNRVLTASEIQQNFNALRGRFGI